MYRPENLTYEIFKTVEALCFPEEPIAIKLFQEWVTRDFWAVYDDNELIGYSYLRLKTELGWIARIAFIPNYRNKGIGSKLMEIMINYCLTYNLPKIILNVQQDNPSAIRLYQKYGFIKTDVRYQYIVPIKRFLNPEHQSSSNRITAAPITEVDESLIPPFSEEWRDLDSLHNPPDNYVLIFRTKGGEGVGYCRLNPDFPGCHPFVVKRVSVNRLSDILYSLKKYLIPEKEELKLTFSDKDLATVCEQLNFKLNYKLFKMEKVIAT